MRRLLSLIIFLLLPRVAIADGVVELRDSSPYPYVKVHIENKGHIRDLWCYLDTGANGRNIVWMSQPLAKSLGFYWVGGFQTSFGGWIGSVWVGNKNTTNGEAWILDAAAGYGDGCVMGMDFFKERFVLWDFPGKKIIASPDLRSISPAASDNYLNWKACAASLGAEQGKHRDDVAALNKRIAKAKSTCGKKCKAM